jgi:hypothetical protein
MAAVMAKLVTESADANKIIAVACENRAAYSVIRASIASAIKPITGLKKMEAKAAAI